MLCWSCRYKFVLVNVCMCSVFVITLVLWHFSTAAKRFFRFPKLLRKLAQKLQMSRDQLPKSQQHFPPNKNVIYSMKQWPKITTSTSLTVCEVVSRLSIANSSQLPKISSFYWCLIQKKLSFHHYLASCRAGSQLWLVDSHNFHKQFVPITIKVF